MQLSMECPRCGEQNARTLQHCWACGEWLHGSSRVVGVCPKCRLPVRETQIACSNCGAYIQAWLAEEMARQRAEEQASAARTGRAARRRRQAQAARRSAAFVTCSVVGGGLVLVAFVRGLGLAQRYHGEVVPGQAPLLLQQAAVWSGLATLGLVLLAVGLLILRPRRR